MESYHFISQLKYVSFKKETRNTIHGKIMMLLEAELYLKNSIPGGIPP